MGAPATSLAMAFVTTSRRAADPVLLRNDPQSMRMRLFAVPAVKVTRKQSPSSSRRYIEIFVDTLVLMVGALVPMKQVEVQAPLAIVVGVERRVRRRAVRILTVHVCRLAAETAVALDVLDDRVF